MAAAAAPSTVGVAAAADPQFPTLNAVDTRAIGRPKNFDGRRDGWKEFRFIFEAFVVAAHPSLGEVMSRAESFGSTPVQPEDCTNMTFSRQLYYVLVMGTTDDASNILGNVDPGNGTEACGRLRWKYEPNVRVRHGAVLHGLLQRASSARTSRPPRHGRSRCSSST